MNNVFNINNSILTPLFSPDSIAVLGASRTEGKVGHDILTNLISSGFTGKIIPVNPAGGELLDFPVVKQLSDYKGRIDLAVIAVPRRQVSDSAREAVSKGARAIIVITSGFREAGEEGIQLEEELLEICRQGGSRLLGPNCLGLINTENKLNASFAGKMPKAGPIAIFSQSGALCATLLNIAESRKLGLSKLISIGNKADIGAVDLLRYFANDDKTEVIVGYLEDIRHGDEFIKAAEEASNLKPVVIFKSGTSNAGQRAATSHTGGLTGDETAYGAAFKRAGIQRPASFDALFDYATAFSTQPLPKGKRVQIITNAGGPGILAADAAEHAGLEVAELNTNQASALRARQPTAASGTNPVDVLGDADPERFGIAIRAAQENNSIHGIIITLTPQIMTHPAETVKVIGESIDGSKPALVSFMGGGDLPGTRRQLAACGLPDFVSPERAVLAFKAMYQYAKWRNRPPRQVTRFPVHRRRAERIISSRLRANLTQLSEVKAKDILRAYGFNVLPGRLATSAEEAVEIAQHIGYPIAMKIVSADIIHKTDLGGVRLHVANNRQVEDAFDLMMLRIKRFAPQASIDGVFIEKMADEGLEVILGMTRDPQFGPMLMFGLGGIFVEVMKDITFHLAPITENEAIQMLKSTKSYEMLQGRRGRKEVDIQAIATGLQRISQLTTDFPQIIELDINPLIVGEIGTEPVVADAGMTLAHN